MSNRLETVRLDETMTAKWVESGALRIDQNALDEEGAVVYAECSMWLDPDAAKTLATFISETAK